MWIMQKNGNTDHRRFHLPGKYSEKILFHSNLKLEWLVAATRRSTPGGFLFIRFFQIPDRITWLIK